MIGELLKFRRIKTEDLAKQEELLDLYHQALGV